MNIYEFLGTARSGHHVIINWAFKNLCGSEYVMHGKFKENKESGLYYINEANLDLGLTFDYLPKISNNCEYLFLSYENSSNDFSLFSPNFKYKAPLDFTSTLIKERPRDRKRIILIRDFYNNLASRIKLNINNIEEKRPPHFSCDVGVGFVNMWKSYARDIVNDRCYSIKFEDWISNKEIRVEFLHDVFGINEIYDSSNITGTLSSFEQGDVTNRIKEVEISDITKNIINSDTELKELIEALGYKNYNL